MTAELAYTRLRRLVSSTGQEGLQGGYAGWITKLATDEVQRGGSPEAMGRILSFLSQGGSLRDYENVVASIVGPSPLARKPWYEPAFLGGAKRVLARAEESFPEIARVASHPVWRASLERSLMAAEKSPLAVLRLRRLARLIAAGDPLLDLKLAEMGDPDVRIRGIQEPPRSFAVQWAQWDAYLGDVSTMVLLSEVARRSSSLLRPHEASWRRERRRRSLEGFVSNFPAATLNRQRVAEALRLLGDAHSLRVAESIERREFEILLLGENFEEKIRELVRRSGASLSNLRTQNAVYFPQGILGAKGVMAVRTRPVDLSPGATVEEILIEVLASVVHEHQHYEDTVPGERRTARAAFRLELRGHAREFLWRAEQGETSWLREYASESPMGFALHFRDHFERHYGSRFLGQ